MTFKMNKNFFDGSDYAVRVDVQLGNHGPKSDDLTNYATTVYDDGLQVHKQSGKVVQMYFVDEDYAKWAYADLQNNWLPNAIEQAKSEFNQYKVQMKLSNKRATKELTEPVVMGIFRETTGIKVL